MTLDSETIIEFPNSEAWAELYVKLRDKLVNSLNGCYSLADREDAVEDAFRKLMYMKDREAYGEKMPRTESEWYWNIRWQARSFLSRIKERTMRHAKYAEEYSAMLAGIFACGHQGESIDSGIMTRALIRALNSLRSEQDISRRDLSIYIGLAIRGISATKLAARFNTNANNIYQIKFRVGKLLRKYGPRCFERALEGEGYGYAKSVA